MICPTESKASTGCDKIEEEEEKEEEAEEEEEEEEEGEVERKEEEGKEEAEVEEAEDDEEGNSTERNNRKSSCFSENVSNFLTILIIPLFRFPSFEPNQEILIENKIEQQSILGMYVQYELDFNIYERYCMILF